jgi:hypothetical protein
MRPKAPLTGAFLMPGVAAAHEHTTGAYFLKRLSRSTPPTFTTHLTLKGSPPAHQ